MTFSQKHPYNLASIFIDLAEMESGKDIIESLPARLRAIRLERGLTQTQVAERLGVTQARYGHYETGYRGVTLKLIPSLAEALETSIEDLLGIEQARPKKRGPASQLEKRFERIRSLPPKDRKFITEAIDRMLGEAKAS